MGTLDEWYARSSVDLPRKHVSPTLQLQRNNGHIVVSCMTRRSNLKSEVGRRGLGMCAD